MEVADQRHQRDVQSESSGMDELDASGQLTSTCKPNPGQALGCDPQQTPAGLCGQTYPQRTHMFTLNTYTSCACRSVHRALIIDYFCILVLLYDLFREKLMHA